MCFVQDYSVLLNNVVISGSWHFTHIWKTLLKIGAIQLILARHIVLKYNVPSKESGHSCICVRASILLLDFFTNICLYSIKIYFGFRDVRSKHLEY
jgi:hypothetical protein